MKRRIALWVLLGLFLVRCSDNTSFMESPAEFQELIPKSDIDEFIQKAWVEQNDFNWGMVSDEMLWSALRHGGDVLTVGYQPEGEGDISGKMHSLSVRSKAWIEAKNDVLQRAVDVINRDGDASVNVQQILLRDHDVLPYVEIRTSDFELVKQLRKMPNVRYVEPIGYEADFWKQAQTSKVESGSGCGNNPAGSISSSDFVTVSPNARASFSYDFMSIRSAWNLSTGRGITVGLIDTGVSSSQSRLGSNFNSGSSSGRFIQKYGFYKGDGSNDKCGHGTQMAGVIASPRSFNGAPVGVAYNCNLVSARGTSDVIVNSGSEKTGVSDALVFYGNRSDIKVISMSIGDVFSSGKVKDAVRYAHGRGKLIFAAAGTSTSFTNWWGVIFPANMSETVAVTGIKDSGYTRCSNCHDGSKVDFAVVMQRASSSSRVPLTLANSGDTPSRVGGSSVATATMAGTAALVWARNPSQSRNQVLQRLKNASQFYPSRSSKFGWGIVNAYNAVR
ncbi:MAG: S8 family serine peptidase [Bacteroidota bacterium]